MIPTCKNCGAWDGETFLAYWRRTAKLGEPLANWDIKRFYVRGRLCQFCADARAPQKSELFQYVPEMDEVAQPGRN